MRGAKGQKDMQRERGRVRAGDSRERRSQRTFGPDVTDAAGMKAQDESPHHSAFSLSLFLFAFNITKIIPSCVLVSSSLTLFISRENKLHTAHKLSFLSLFSSLFFVCEFFCSFLSQLSSFLFVTLNFIAHSNASSSLEEMRGEA